MTAISSVAPYRHALLLVAVAWAFASGCTARKPVFTTVIASEVALSESLPAEFPLVAERDSVWLVDADQHAIDVQFELVGAEGNILRTTDSPSRRGGNERAVFEVPRGRFAVRVRSADYPGKTARVSIAISRADAADIGHDDPWWRAELLESAAAAAFVAGTDIDVRAAFHSYQRAAWIWRALGEPVREATARYRLGWLAYRMLSDPAAAAMNARYAAGLIGRRSMPQLHAHFLVLASSAANDQSSGMVLPESLRVLERSRSDLAVARTLFERTGNAYGVAEVLQTIAQTEHCAGNYSLARAKFLEAAALYEELDEQDGLNRALVNAAQMSYSLGDFRAAIEVYDRVLDSPIVRSRPAMLADMLDNSAHSRLVVGDLQRALGLYLTAMDMHRAVHDEAGVGRSQHGIGRAYLGLGNPQRALEHLEQAIATREKARDSAGVLSSLLALGDVYRDLGNYDMAIAIHRRAMRRARQATHVERSRTLLALARDLIAARQYAQATDLLAELLALSDSADGLWIEALARMEMGRVHLGTGHYDEALHQLSPATAVFSRGGAPLSEAEALHLMAQADRARARPDSALNRVRRALQRVEDARAAVTHPEFRARLLATRRALYDLHVNLHLDAYASAPPTLRQAALQTALRASELVRARALTDYLAMSAAVEDPGDDALASARAAAGDLAAKEYRLQTMSTGNANSDAALAAALKEELADLRMRYDEALARIPLRAGTVQQDRLDQPALPPDTALLVYFASNERSWMWVITSDDMAGHRLEAQRTIIDAVADLRHAIARRSGGHQQALHRLSRLLLPDQSVLRTRTRWIVVADGPIGSVPFAALHLEDGRNVVERHEVTFATTLQAATHTARAPLSVSHTRGAPVVFADPVYSSSDERLRMPVPAQTLRLQRTQRLPGSRREAAVVADHLRMFEPRVVTGFAATREAALSSTAGTASILHFAVHAQGMTAGMKSPILQLSAYDEAGNERNGALTLHDLILARVRADLVVLSACEAATGEQIPGEGQLSVAYGFLAAGAGAVIATQWSVPDAAMADLMDRFYANAVVDGQSVAHALRVAQLSLLRSGKWRAPQWWAAPTLIVSL